MEFELKKVKSVPVGDKTIDVTFYCKFEGSVIDNGIGSYEYWGARGVDTQLCWEAGDIIEFGVDMEASGLQSIEAKELKAIATFMMSIDDIFDEEDFTSEMDKHPVSDDNYIPEGAE